MTEIALHSEHNFGLVFLAHHVYARTWPHTQTQTHFTVMTLRVQRAVGSWELLRNRRKQLAIDARYVTSVIVTSKCRMTSL